MWYYSLLIRYVCQLDGFLLCPKFCQQCKQAFDRFHCYVFFDVLPTFWACAARIESDSISIHPPTRGPFGTHDAPAAIVEELHSDVRIVGCSGGIGG
jgi:hypothetical protein